MSKCLLSIDWDYFVCMKKINWGSYMESKRTIVDLWYKRYIQFNSNGKNLEKSFQLSMQLDKFWKDLKKHFQFSKDVQAYVSDSHALSYDIAKKNDCSTVYLFDAHSDLGYGGISSLDFELNCANWLGKLLKNNQIRKANIIYSPFTSEKPQNFKQINSKYDVQFESIDELEKGIDISAIHICRSGAWTPPWFDKKFYKFVDELKVPYKIIDCPTRKWEPENLSLSEKIYYSMA